MIIPGHEKDEYHAKLVGHIFNGRGRIVEHIVDVGAAYIQRVRETWHLAQAPKLPGFTSAESKIRTVLNCFCM
jgi:hypothetical protein